MKEENEIINKEAISMSLPDNYGSKIIVEG